MKIIVLGFGKGLIFFIHVLNILEHIGLHVSGTKLTHPIWKRFLWAYGFESICWIFFCVEGLWTKSWQCFQFPMVLFLACSTNEAFQTLSYRPSENRSFILVYTPVLNSGGRQQARSHIVKWFFCCCFLMKLQGWFFFSPWNAIQWNRAEESKTLQGFPIVAWGNFKTRLIWEDHEKTDAQILAQLKSMGILPLILSGVGRISPVVRA